MKEKDLSKGYTCECCGQFVKAYTRNLNVSMALVLILMFRSGKTGYWHIEKWLKEIGKPELRADYHKLRFWGFIEAKSGEREDGSKRNGYYKITGRGIAFADGKITAQKSVVIFNNKFRNFEGEEIDIRAALRSKFNYDELMNYPSKKSKTKEVLSNQQPFL